ncbi:class I SAM-dependent methyltransferase [Natronococcus occultus]|uniref:Methylase involved in ubiquinone/menaquinone biosynthesis n=1 Tax=Natronococcus occultus SP4 TaxID=694430 RepID=L0K087_9EURY|nr:class I SAM-dependent methyltransferase [Natronococcus occultus]AGB38712.1 methylase involved in ubiquinone/menaquinone biosynthesis [Natronococcus occultus SP4]
MTSHAASEEPRGVDDESSGMTIADIQAAYADAADLAARFDRVNRLLTGRYRRRQFADAEGRVLEVACGTGTNLRYLPDSVEYVGIDISEAMLARAWETLDRVDVDGRLERMDAQELSFADDSFDTVLSSFSTCTFPDPVAALDEMARVCRPDGRVLLIEHGPSDVDLLARYQEYRAAAHYERSGCRLTQEPLDVLERSTLVFEESDTAQLGRITTITARPPRDGEVDR